ncbi:hypothetical protein N7488_005160 [Penicillium malachiteum]|nr:hypothetical protein N7488_005160 [Penicillium malachiteum]
MRKSVLGHLVSANKSIEYKAWLNNPEGFLWIKGNPGTGKSVLMKFAVRSMVDRNTGQLVFFFIHGQGTQLQRSALGLFRALLNHILDSFPEYLSQFTEVFVDRQKRFGSYEEDRWAWSEDELQQLLSQILTQGIKDRPVIIFIDALDECGQKSARDLLKYFKELIKEVRRARGQVKLCFSSRHYPILGHDSIPSIVVESHNANDIQRIIGDLLEEIEFEEDHKAIEENTIGTKREYLRSTLTTIPVALDKLYSMILHDVRESDTQQMVKLFRWVLFAERPLSAHELRDALSIDKEMESGTQLRSHSTWSDSLATFEVHVRQISKGLVEFRTREVWEQYEPGEEESDREAQFIHQSVAEFLLDDFLGGSVHGQCPQQSVVGAGHFQISRCCQSIETDLPTSAMPPGAKSCQSTGLSSNFASQ